MHKLRLGSAVRWLRTENRGPWAVLAALGCAALMAPLGVAATGDSLREGQRNGTASRETQIVANVDATTANTGGFSTRQSNLSDSGGGAIYGCRSTAGGTAANPPKNPCIRANNLSTGYAFEFNAERGAIAGLITAGDGGDSKKPFITNATGVATGLNADRVDGLDAAQIVALVRAGGGAGGAAGGAGATGPAGPAGPAGANGVTGYEVDGFYTTEDLTPNAGEPVPAGAEYEIRTAQCDEGKHATGGGFSGSGGSAEDTGGPDTDLVARASYPSGLEAIEGDAEGSVRATSWSVAFDNPGADAEVGRVWIACADVG